MRVADTRSLLIHSHRLRTCLIRQGDEIKTRTEDIVLKGAHGFKSNVRGLEGGEGNKLSLFTVSDSYHA